MTRERERSQTDITASAQNPEAAAGALTRRPPQSAGVDPRLFTLGASPRHVRYGIATRILADPAARTRFSQPYSGQRRLWQE